MAKQLRKRFNHDDCVARDEVTARKSAGALGALSGSTPGAVLWLTGLSGAGKTTLANVTKAEFDSASVRAVVLDGDELRTRLNAGLRFSPEDRRKNVRRIAEVSTLFKDAGLVAICALISSIAAHRELAREIVGDGFLKVYVRAPIEICERRDPKGLYQRARCGEIPSFTGIASPYEIPVQPDLVVDTTNTSIADAARALVDLAARNVSQRRLPTRDARVRTAS